MDFFFPVILIADEIVRYCFRPIIFVYNSRIKAYDKLRKYSNYMLSILWVRGIYRQELYIGYIDPL